MSVTIQQAQLKDVDVVAPLFSAYRSFYEQQERLDEARSFLHARLTNQESVIFLAVDVEENGLGFVQLYPLFSSVRMAKTWLLNDLFVAESARRQGIAEMLMQAASDFAQQSGAIRLELATAPDNVQAQAVYEKLGYARDDFYHYSLSLS